MKEFKKKSSKKHQIPPTRELSNSQNNKNKHTISDCYSITIRTGKGINLGSNSFSKVINQIKNISKYYVLALEMEDDKRHLQGGIFLETPIRQDKIREKLLQFVIEMWEEEVFAEGNIPTETGRQNVIKNALCVVRHTDWRVLVRYCLKEPTMFSHPLLGHKSPINLHKEGLICPGHDVPLCLCYDYMMASPYYQCTYKGQTIQNEKAAKIYAWENNMNLI